jgi:hypothetical protein
MSSTGKRHKPEQIVKLLREMDVLTAHGKAVPQACKQTGVSDKTYYRWRKVYGGLKVDHALRFRQIEAENALLSVPSSVLCSDKKEAQSGSMTQLFGVRHGAHPSTRARALRIEAYEQGPPSFLAQESGASRHRINDQGLSIHRWRVPTVTRPSGRVTTCHHVARQRMGGGAVGT